MAYGQINADVIQSSVTGVSLGAGNATRFKNRIINGNMVIDQRNAGASVTQGTTGTQYCLDRWLILGTQASKFTVQQNAGSVTPPVGYSNYLGCTSSSAYSVTSTDYFGIQQRIEGFNTADLAWGTANAKTVTLSFQVYSSLTGTFGGVITNSAYNYSYPFTYTISSASTWTSISVTIAGPTTGTWIGATNGIGLVALFGIGVGSTYSGTAGSWSANTYFSATGATSVVGTSGATFYITGVQLEVGSSATGFEVVDCGTQLLMCQRYYEKLGWTQSEAPGSTSGYIGALLSLPTGVSSQFMGFTWQVTKRAIPTITTYGSIASGVETSGIAVDWYTGTTIGACTVQRGSVSNCNYIGTASPSSYGAMFRVVMSAEL